MIKYYLIFSLIIFSSIEAKNNTPVEAPSDFLSLCKATLTYKTQALPLCEEIHKKFFSQNKTNDIAVLNPADLKVEPSPIDHKIQYFIFNDPNYLAGIAYCYFVYRNWISPSQISPDQLGLSATGFSILNEEIPQYQKWLVEKAEGKKCKERVEKEAEVSVANLEISLKGKAALIGLNPFASIQGENPTLESVLEEMKITVNHERIHAYHVTCPEFEKWSIKEWEKLPSKEKNEYIKKYPSYTWTIPKIAGREYIGFKYEANPEKLQEFVKNCKTK
jgi:hypothetical protein